MAPAGRDGPTGSPLPRRLAGGAAALLALAWSWWATDRAPFSAAAYAVVGLPVALCAFGALSRGRRRLVGPVASAAAPAAGRRRLVAAGPWLLLLALALALEAGALALGGRSHRWPTLSDAVDGLLRWHGARLALYAAWLAAGLLLVRASGRRHARARGG